MEQEISEFKNPEAACEHFLWSEKAYVEKDLRTCMDTQQRLVAHVTVNRPIIRLNEIEKLFANFVSIYQGHEKLLEDLMAHRLEGKDYFVKKLGVIMIQFIPFFRMYTDYMTRKGERQDALEKLPKKTKKFKDFCELEKEIHGKKLKALLKAPLERLPQYLRFMGQVHSTFENKRCQPALDIMECIKKIAEVMDDIATKAKDMKARRQVGLLQSKLFQNKINLAIPSRFVVKHEELSILVLKALAPVTLVLFNDIIILALAPAGFRGICKLENAWPLSGLKVSTEISDPDTDNQKFRFSIIRKKPNNEVNTMILICNRKEQLDVWVNKIHEWIDRAEHCKCPVNPVQLMRRLRNQKTKGEGSLDNIRITDPQRLREIDAWEATQRASRQSRKKKRLSIDNNVKPSPRLAYEKVSSGKRPLGRGAGSSPARPRGPPPGVPGQRKSPRPQRPNFAPPGNRKKPKPKIGSSREAPPSHRKHYQSPNKNTSKAPPRPPSSNKGVPTSQPPQFPATRPTKPAQRAKPAFLADIGKGFDLKKSSGPVKAARNSPMGLLGEIQAGKKLKKVKRGKRKVASVATDLESNIARYRKYVCDSDEDTKSDSSDDDWD